MSRSERRPATIVFTKVVGHMLPGASREAKRDRLCRRFSNLLHRLLSSTPGCGSELGSEFNYAHDTKVYNAFQTQRQVGLHADRVYQDIRDAPQVTAQAYAAGPQAHGLRKRELPTAYRHLTQPRGTRGSGVTEVCTAGGTV